MNMQRRRRSSLAKSLGALLLLIGTPSCGRPAPQLNLDDPRSPLHLVRKIALPNVSGRIDHLALDAEHGRLFVAEYGNGSVDEIDLASGSVSARIAGLHEPQGVAWLPKQQEIAVASGDGSLRFYSAADRRQVAAISLGDDADNERVDPRTGNLLVGYGSGGIAIVDPAAHKLVRALKLAAHPEAFAMLGPRVFVNVPDAHAIVTGDVDRGQVVRSMSTGDFGGNFPMAADEARAQIAVAYRFPATVSVIDEQTGAVTFSVGTCGDADDIYFDADRILVVCGGGAVDVIDRGPGHAAVRVRTRGGARTGLLDAAHGRLFVAVPARGGPAEIWELAIK